MEENETLYQPAISSPFKIDTHPWFVMILLLLLQTLVLFIQAEHYV